MKATKSASDESIYHYLKQHSDHQNYVVGDDDINVKIEFNVYDEIKFPLPKVFKICIQEALFLECLKIENVILRLNKPKKLQANVYSTRFPKNTRKNYI